MKNTSQEKEKRIKSFIYLDEYKMYSISSQIFEGLTEYVMTKSAEENEEYEGQLEPEASGRLLGDIIKRTSTIEEKRFLHDHSFNLFEERLRQRGRVLEISDQNIEEDSRKIYESEFVLIRGKILFNDIKIIKKTLGKINSLMESIALLQASPDLRKKISEKESSHKNRGFQEKNKSSDSQLSKLMEDLGLEKLDDVFIKSLLSVLDYAYQEQFEVRMYLKSLNKKDYLFSSSLKRHYLRENEDMIMRKYSRYSEKEFVVFGAVTQDGSQPSIYPKNDKDDQIIKETVVGCTLALSDIEKRFTGTLANEIVIDPIAVYREL